MSNFETKGISLKIILPLECVPSQNQMKGKHWSVYHELRNKTREAMESALSKYPESVSFWKDSLSGQLTQIMSTKNTLLTPSDSQDLSQTTAQTTLSFLPEASDATQEKKSESL